MHFARFILLSGIVRTYFKSSVFDAGRVNNQDFLTFGYGAHACLAARFSIRLATDTFSYLLHTYPGLQWYEQDIKWEPLINVRLPERILVRPG